MCAVAAVRAQRRGSTPMWAATAAALVGAAAVKAFGVQTWLTDRGRALAQQEGWYADRRPLQAIAIVVVLLAAAAAGAVLLRAARRWGRRESAVPHGWAERLAAVSTVAAVALAGVRAMSLHHVDAVLHAEVLPGVQVGWALEALCLAGILVAALAVLIRRG